MAGFDYLGHSILIPLTILLCIDQHTILRLLIITIAIRRLQWTCLYCLGLRALTRKWRLTAGTQFVKVGMAFSRRTQ